MKVVYVIVNDVTTADDIMESVLAGSPMPRGYLYSDFRDAVRDFQEYDQALNPRVKTVWVSWKSTGPAKQEGFA